MAPAFHDWNAATMTLRIRLLSIVAIVILCVGAAWYWLLHTHSGAVWVLGQAESMTEGAFALRSIDGDLSGGLALQGVSYGADSLDVTAERATVTIDVDLLPLSVEVVTARIESIRVAISDTPDSPDSQETSTDILEIMSNLQLPFRVRISGLVVDG